MSHTESPNEASARKYDEVAYRSTSIAECDPLRMALVAQLHGLPVIDPNDCDILDIGCGDGSNILSLGVMYPGSRSVGFDVSPVAVARGNEVREAAGLENVSLVTELPDDAVDGSADYVIAHGVLSWVHEGPRREVVELAGRAARPGALVTFSYNTTPAGHFRMAAREVAFRAIQQAERERGPLSIDERAAIGIERLRLVAELTGTKHIYGQVLAAEAERMAVNQPWFLFHDDLADPMEPLALSEVVALCEEHGLRYVGELFPQDMWQARLKPDLVEKLQVLGGTSASERQQLVDDLIGTVFHSTLFVKADETPRVESSTDGLTLHVRGFAPGTQDGDLRADAVSAPVSATIRENVPQAVTVHAIAEELGRDPHEIAATVLKLYSLGLARVSTFPPPVPADPGEFPLASPLVRQQVATEWTLVTTRFHHAIAYPDRVLRALMGLLDGTRDRDAIRRDLPDVAAATGATAGLEAVLASLDEVLAQAATEGLLMSPTDA